LQLKVRELQIQYEKKQTKHSLVSETKAFADALKGTISYMPTDVVHLLSYFQDAEHLFTTFEVPNELRAQILRPYLNEKAKTLVSRMQPEFANDYTKVKEMLLREFKLSPAVYLKKFNTDSRKPEETRLLYSARLTAILNAYLNSCKVN